MGKARATLNILRHAIRIPHGFRVNHKLVEVPRLDIRESQGLKFLFCGLIAVGVLGVCALVGRIFLRVSGFYK